MVMLVSEASNRYTHLFLVKRQYFGFNTLESVIVERNSITKNPRTKLSIFFYYHKINLHLGISIFVQLFFLCFLKYESFSNCQQ
jgi:hypothetical protein